jgi:hypothetical protein
LKWIVHDWDDERAIRILRNCRQVMADQARLLLMEVVLPDRITPGPRGAAIDIHMLVLTGGRERTESEYRGLLAAAGFQLTGITATQAHGVFESPMSLIEAVPARAPS